MAIFIAPKIQYQAPAAALPRDKLAPILIPDGNARHGYRGSAAKVVEVAEHCARRPDITQLTIFLLSGQNILRRSSGSLSQVAATVWQVRAMLQARGALKRAGVRCTLVGSLTRLQQRGEAGAAIAAGLRSLIEATAATDKRAPRLTLQLAVDCDDTLLDTTRANAVIRTAAERPSVFRPSSLTLSGGVMYMAASAPWPALDVETIDAAVEALAAAPASWTVPGADFIAALIDAIEPPEDAPLHLIVPIQDARDELRASLALRRVLRAQRAIVQLTDGTLIGRDQTAPRIRVSLLAGDKHSIAEGKDDVMVLPNQRGQALWVPPQVSPRRWFSLHGCGPDIASIASAVNQAAIFQKRYPPLYGADRFPAQGTPLASLGRGVS